MTCFVAWDAKLKENPAALPRGVALLMPSSIDSDSTMSLLINALPMPPFLSIVLLIGLRHTRRRREDKP